MQHADFLIEIHTAELPPKSLLALAENFCAGITTRLQKNELTFKESCFFATPRRLAVLVTALISDQPDKAIERKGPALDKAYDADGKPTPACVGFARSAGIDVSELVTLETAQGKFVGCKQQIKGKHVTEILPALVEEALTALPIPKPMRWGAHPQKFIRPVYSVIMLYGKDIIDADILGCKTDRKTYGHRFMHPEVVEIAEPSTYENTLEKAFVIADFKKRQKKISEEIRKIQTKKLGDDTHIVNDQNLLEEVTSLVEWPHAICGSFEKAFLQVPVEALTAAMMDHQRYFPVFSGSNQLLPNFIAISNIVSKDDERIVKGNERVLRARLSDAAFFYETDKKISLRNRVEKLQNIIFQNKIGTLYDKTKSLEGLAAYIAKHIGADTATTERAATLSKTDLTTELVGEFPELQGIAGSYYAKHDGESTEIATALSEQYKPRFSGDDLPQTSVGCALAIADRLYTLIGIFGINQPPTGDKDPFGLRRAALGILRIVIENKFNLNLQKLIEKASHYIPGLENKNVANDVLNFILDRLKPWYQEQGINANTIAAVMALKNMDNPYDISRRIEAVTAFEKLPEADALSAANKRVSNILAKYDGQFAESLREKLFENDAERDLAKQIEHHAKMIEKFSEAAEYQKILSQLANLRAPVDNFFDHVMVMTDDKAKRENRLLMLKKLRELFLHVADIALLQ
jgi:glycyl-tRNA synthetase beta chain